MIRFSLSRHSASFRFLEASATNLPLVAERAFSNRRRPPFDEGDNDTGVISRRPSRKPNFDRSFLEPAARGEMDYKQKIPKLTGRKQKVRLTPKGIKNARSADPLISQVTNSDEYEDDEEVLTSFKSTNRKAVPTSFSNSGESVTTLRQALSLGRRQDEERIHAQQNAGNDLSTGLQSVNNMYFEFGEDEYYDPSLLDNEHDYYWREEDYDNLHTPNAEFDAEIGALGEDDMFEIPYDEEEFTGAYSDGQFFFMDSQAKQIAQLDDGSKYVAKRIDQDSDADEDDENVTSREAWQREDPEEQFFFGQDDVMSVATLPEDAFPDSELDDIDLHNMVLPLQTNGPGLDAFLQGNIEHPTNFASVQYKNEHPNSQREPKPVFPKSRLQPTQEFLESYTRFMYVDGLPTLHVEGQVGDITNSVHADALKKQVAQLISVETVQVYPASANSAYVGFSSPVELAAALRRGPAERVLSSQPQLLPVSDDLKDHAFVKNAPDGTVLFLRNLPPHHSLVTLAEALFPKEQEVGKVYDVSPENLLFTSSQECLIRFKSAEEATSASDSQLIRSQLDQMGRAYPVRLYRARRELVHAGFIGPDRREKRNLGPRLVVDGDMCTKPFYISHAAVLFVRNLDPNLSKQYISDMVQPFCTQHRDVDGSIEFVEDHEGQHNGCAYVGFDALEEAQAALKHASRIWGDRSVRLVMVKDRRIPNRPDQGPESRLERPVEELLVDLNDWERYVDPKDLEELMAAGISKTSLDEALRTFRFHNPTFGTLDTSVSTEKLKPELASGEDYKELVQLYIESLKECLPTKDEPGDMYEAVHYPDESIDLSIFDHETKRQEKLSEMRENP